LQQKTGGHWATQIIPGDKLSETVKAAPAGGLPEAVALFAINRFGNMSPAATYRHSVK
jgi:hypothetical protein